MKFYSYTNNNKNYTKAITLSNIRSVHMIAGDGKSAIRFYVRIDYIDGEFETLSCLEQDEAKRVYEEIIKLLNQ